jgi:hypothetical protein
MLRQKPVQNPAFKRIKRYFKVLGYSDEEAKEETIKMLNGGYINKSANEEVIKLLDNIAKTFKE